MDVDGGQVPVDGVDDKDLRDPSGKKQKTVLRLRIWQRQLRTRADNSQRDESLKLAMNESSKLAVGEAVGILSDDLHHDFINWEAKMDDKVQTQLLIYHSDYDLVRWMALFLALNAVSRKCRRVCGQELEGPNGKGGQDHDKQGRDTSLYRGPIGARSNDIEK